MNSPLAVASNVAAYGALAWYIAAFHMDRPEQLRPANRLLRTASTVLSRGWWPAYVLYVGWVALWTVWWLRGEEVDPGELAGCILLAFGLGVVLALRPLWHHIQLEIAELRQRDRHD